MSHVPLDVWGLIVDRCSPLCMIRLVSTCRALHARFSNRLELKKWKRMDPNEWWYEAAREGNRDLVDLFISKGALNQGKAWNAALCGAAEGGHRALVDFFISNGAYDWNGALYSASHGGHRKLVDFFIENGSDDWYLAIFGASQGGYYELVEFFEKKIKIV